jgi:hypothetical protein
MSLVWETGVVYGEYWYAQPDSGWLYQLYSCGNEPNWTIYASYHGMQLFVLDDRCRLSIAEAGCHYFFSLEEAKKAAERHYNLMILQ